MTSDASGAGDWCSWTVGEFALSWIFLCSWLLPGELLFQKELARSATYVRLPSNYRKLLHFFWTSKNTLSEALHILVSASREAIWTSSESEKNQNYDVWTLQLNYDVFTLQLDYASLQVRGWRKESFLDYKWSCGCIQKFHLCSKLIYSTQCLLIKYHQVDGTAVAIFNWGEGGGKKKYIFKNLFSSSALVSYMCIGHGDTSGITCFLYTI